MAHARPDYHNETGFNTASPYTDGTDVLLSDCAADVLARYPILVLATPIISARAETRDKLEAYVHGGGTLVVNAEALASLPLLGASLDPSALECSTVAAGSTVTVTPVGGGSDLHVIETEDVRVCPLGGAEALDPIAVADGSPLAFPLAYSTTAGKGTLVVLTSSGMAAEPVAQRLAGITAADTELPNPYPMAAHARALLDGIFSSGTPFSAGDGLSVVVNRVGGAGSVKYLVAIANPSGHALPFSIKSHVGAITHTEEIVLQDAGLGPSIVAQNFTGYTPPGSWELGSSSASAIAGFDQRIFRVTVAQETASLIDTVAPAASPNRIALPLPSTADLTESIMLRPTFGQHFDAVVVDWSYVERRSATQARPQPPSCACTTSDACACSAAAEGRAMGVHAEHQHHRRLHQRPQPVSRPSAVQQLRPVRAVHRADAVGAAQDVAAGQRVHAHHRPDLLCRRCAQSTDLQCTLCRLALASL